LNEKADHEISSVVSLDTVLEAQAAVPPPVPANRHAHGSGPSYSVMVRAGISFCLSNSTQCVGTQLPFAILPTSRQAKIRELFGQQRPMQADADLIFGAALRLEDTIFACWVDPSRSN
jgi:hypothetical protein